VSWFVDVLVHRLVAVGEEGLCEALAGPAGTRDKVSVIARLWRSPSTATDTVLAAIGEMHPSKIVARRLARRAFSVGAGSARRSPKILRPGSNEMSVGRPASEADHPRLVHIWCTSRA
jgi:hypothetical protein